MSEQQEHPGTPKQPARPAPEPASPTAPPPASAERTASGSSSSASMIPNWERLVLGAGVLALIGSFLPFYSISANDLGGAAPDVNWTAWSNAVNLFPVSTLAVLYILAAGVHVALGRFTETSLPNRILGFDWSELRLVFGGLAALTLLAYLLRSFEGGLDKGIGLFLVLAASVALVVGAVMERQGRAGQAGGEISPSPASTGDWIVMASGIALVVGSFLNVFSLEGESVNAWDKPLFPLYIVPALLGVAMAAQLAATTLAGRGVPARIAGLRTADLHKVLGLHAALMMVGFLIGNALFDFAPDPDRGIGFWVMLLAALGLVAGTFMREQEASAPPSQAASPPPRA